MHKLELDGDDAEELRRALGLCLHDSPEARYAQRVQCLLLVASGYGCKEVARCYGKTPRTLERWVRIYQRFGPMGLRDEKKPGRGPTVDTGMLKEIAADLDTDPRSLGYREAAWNGSLLALHIQEKLHIALSERQGQRLFRRLRGIPRPGDATPIPSPVVRSGSQSA